MFGLTVSKVVRDYFKLVAVLAIIAVGFYVALYGPRYVFVAAGFVVALLLFWVRYRHRIFYGAIEILAGIFTLWQQYPTGRGSFSGWFAEAFQRYDWHVVFLTTLAGVHIVVRGLDNISQGWERLWK